MVSLSPLSNVPIARNMSVSPTFRRRLFRSFQWLTTVVGGLVCIYSVITTYLPAASTAGLVAKLVDNVGFYGLVVTAPIIAIVFVTYRTYLKNIESVAAQAEQARSHVLELSHYIAEQERIREQFSQVEKLSALGELASGVAHDFNNTLAGILGRAQLLLRTNDPEKIQRGLNLIIKTAEER